MERASRRNGKISEREGHIRDVLLRLFGGDWNLIAFFNLHRFSVLRTGFLLYIIIPSIILLVGINDRI
jgi:hypothetical protein